jgi:hypothetical protein
MMMSSRFALGLACVLVGACSSSSTPDKADASSSKDSGIRVDAGTMADVGIDAGPPQPVFSADAGSTWTALYRDYFGNEAASNTAGCANGSICHGSMTESGFQTSNFYCPKENAKACYVSFTSQDAGPYLVSPDAGWENDDLSMILCQVDDAGAPLGGVMPYLCVYNFTPSDVTRIKAWIAAGYPDN